MAERYLIRSSTAEFLISQIQNKKQSVEMFYKDKTVWCTLKAMGMLFDCSVDNIWLHLKNIYKSGELEKEKTFEEIPVVRREGNRDVNRTLQFYNLDAIICVGYRVNSIRAIQFRQWATSVLREAAIRGYVLDKKRIENGTIFGEDYFDHLLAEIMEIRLSERNFYQKLTDIYATSMDYNKNAPTTRIFFKRIQDKMLYPDGIIAKTNASIAKNYLKQVEPEDMERIMTAVLEFAERRAKKHLPMTMEDWSKRIDAYLTIGVV